MDIRHDIVDALKQDIEAYVAAVRPDAFTPIGVSIIVACQNLRALLEVQYPPEGGKSGKT